MGSRFRLCLRRNAWSGRWSGLLCGLAFLAGCGPDAAPDPNGFGRFEGEIVAVWDADGRKMTLREDFAYVDSRGRRWVAPAASVVDGASIPRAFWTFIGGPFEGKYRSGSVIHDVGCATMRDSWQDVHRMFYEACRCGGVDERQAKMMYYAVYHFGPRWAPVTDTMIARGDDGSGRIVEQQVTVQRMSRIDPPPPTTTELDQVHAFITESDPAPAQIEQLDRAALHRQWSGRRRTRTRVKADSPDRQPAAPDARKTRDARETRGARGARDEAPRAEIAIEAAAQEIPFEERQWAIEIARQYLEQLAGEPRLAEYHVERAPAGYRVVARFVHQDEQGQAAYAGGHSSMLVSRDGQVVEAINGE